MADWLDYGSLGLLAIVLVAIGAAGREVLRKWQERQNQQVGAEVERMAKQDEFLRSLIEQDRQDRKAQLQEWRELVAKDIEAKLAMTEVLAGLCDRGDQHEQRANQRWDQTEQRADERHQAMMATVGD